MTDPRLQPRAPAVATNKRLNRPVDTRYPAKGMMISEGRGMQADSMLIRAITPRYPAFEMTAIMKPASVEIIFSSMNLEEVPGFQRSAGPPVFAKIPGNPV